jgi:DNA-binding IclR family transcriptional regulator
MGKMGKTAPAKSIPPARISANADQYFSRAVSKSLEVLGLLQASGSSMSLHEIALSIKLSKTSTFRLLRTLEASGCLLALGSGEYQLAVGIHSVVPTLWLARLLSVARDRMQKLNHNLGETVSLAALFDNRMEVVAVIESPQVIRMSNVVGHILPPNSSSLGKVITAFQTDALREKLLQSYGSYRFTENSIIDRMELQEEFARVRKAGFATDREENVANGICFGVPIFDASHEVKVALSTSFPKDRVRDAEHEAAIVSTLRSTSEQISADLYFNPEAKEPTR